MREEVIFAGFGGQGVLFAGRLVCVAAMGEGKYVSHFPSYGAEKRGGTSNCSVVISDEEIASPVVFRPSVCVVFNKPSLAKFEPRTIPGGLFIYNRSLIDIEPSRTDVRAVGIEANRLAEQVGSSRVANMIAVGVLLSLVPTICSLDSAIAALGTTISERHAHLRDVNVTALRLGYECAP